MKVYLNKITGIDDAIVSMYFSKRTWTREKELHIREVCDDVLNADGRIWNSPHCYKSENIREFNGWMDSLCRFGTKHITLLRFIDFSITVDGLHRAGQDDWDAHAKRYDNRIIRASTRLADFSGGEMSDFYRGKIIPTDMALSALGISMPDTVEREGQTYVKAVNGYILKGMEDNRDVKRGLYMLSIPSSFIFKVNLTEWAHVYKERRKEGGANPEVKECCESIADQIERFHRQFNRELFMSIQN